MTHSLEITDEDRKAADSYSGLDTMKMGDPAERIARGISYVFIKGAKYGKLQGALEVIKLLESDASNRAFGGGNVHQGFWASWLREKLGVKGVVTCKTGEHFWNDAGDKCLRCYFERQEMGKK